MLQKLIKTIGSISGPIFYQFTVGLQASKEIFLSFLKNLKTLRISQII